MKCEKCGKEIRSWCNCLDDDWNIKKEIILARVPIDTLGMEWEDIAHCTPKSLEKLRRKLIEEIDSYPLPPYDDVISNYSVRLDLIRLVNKLFGVEE